MKQKYTEKHKEALKSESQAKKLRDEKRFDEAANKFKEAAYAWKKLRNEQNYLWCTANHYFFRGIDLQKDKKHEEAYFQFERSREFFRKIGITKQISYCEARMCDAKAGIARNNHNFVRSANLFFKARELITDISENLRAYYEFQAHISLGLGEMRVGDYSKAKTYFKIAEATARASKDYQNANWAKAHICECEYYHAKDEGDLQRIIKALERVVGYYARTKDQTGILVGKGDLAKYRGLWLKIGKKFVDAKQCFDEAISWYRQASEHDQKHSYRHQFSASYASALVVGTGADIDLLLNKEYYSASTKYYEASKKFASCGDEKSASVYLNLSQLCKYLANGNLKEATSVLGILSLDFRPTPGPTSIMEFLSHTSLMITRHTSKIVNEIIELDKGPSFEARVRELILSFDNREVDGREIRVLPHSIEKLKLSKYEKVERKILKPKTDEIGIVFEDDTPVEIDILAERIEGNRRFLLLAECQHSPRKVFGTRELTLLEKKADLVKVRYKKLAELSEESQPIIEQKWFITTGNFDDYAIKFAQSNNIILVGIVALNSLLKLFKFPRIREQK